jgi:hypothetical protein
MYLIIIILDQDKYKERMTKLVNAAFIMDNTITENFIYTVEDIQNYLVDIFHDIAEAPDLKDTAATSNQYYSISGKLGTYYGDGFDMYVTPIFIR